MLYVLALCLVGWPCGLTAQELALGPSEVGLIKEVGLATPALAASLPDKSSLARFDRRSARNARDSRGGATLRSPAGATLERWAPPPSADADVSVSSGSGDVDLRPGEVEGGLAYPGADAGVRQFSAYPVPWVEATGWEKAPLPYEDSLYEHRPFQLEDWDLFRGDIAVDSPPGFVGAYRQSAPFAVAVPRGSKLSRKLKRLARKKVHQEVRRAVKRRWRTQFRDSNMSYGQYRSQMVRIRNIGKNPDEIDAFDPDFNTDEVREDLFQEQYRDGERGIPLLTWGPLTLTDAGSMYLDLGEVDSDETETIDLGPEREGVPSFLATKDYRVDTRFQFDVKPERLLSSDTLDFVHSYGITVEVDWLSDVLARETFGAELQLEVDDRSEVAGFFNFVIKSR